MRDNFGNPPRTRPPNLTRVFVSTVPYNHQPHDVEASLARYQERFGARDRAYARVLATIALAEALGWREPERVVFTYGDYYATEKS